MFISTSIRQAKQVHQALILVLTSQYIGFSDIENFADLTSTNTQSIPYSAELVLTSSTPDTGSFNSTLTITVYYN